MCFPNGVDNVFKKLAGKILEVYDNLFHNYYSLFFSILLLCIHYLGFPSLNQTVKLIRIIKSVFTHRYFLHLLWCFSSFSSIKSLVQEMIICPNSSQGGIVPIYKRVNTLIITNWSDFLAWPVLFQSPAQSHYPCQVAITPFYCHIFISCLAISTH